MRSTPHDPWFRLRLLGGVAIGVLFLGAIGYSVVEGWSFLDALYMTLITLTTVGFGEVHVLDTSGRILTVGLIVVGVVLVGTTVGLLAQLIQEGGLGERGRRRRMQKRIDSLGNHYIVCGYGRVGRAVAHQLAEVRVQFVIIDRSEDVEDEFLAKDMYFEIGDATQEDVLLAAGADRARGLFCALPDDPDNVFIALAARSINPDITIVSRVSDPGAVARLQQARVDHIVSPYDMSGRHMAMAALERS